MELEKIAEIGFNSLKQAYYVQRELLEQGTIAQLVLKGTGEDKATKGDWESEEAVINYLKREIFPGRIISEEHGQIDVIKNPQYLAILDGIDGSSALVKDPNTRCGTILTISDKLNPTYDHFIFSGITEYITKRIVYGVKRKGVWLVENLDENETMRKLPYFKDKKFSSDMTIKIDCYNVSYAPGITKGMSQFEEFMNENVVSKLKGKMNLTGSITNSEMSIDLLLGKVDAVAHIVAKGVFEPPNTYLLTSELGGYACDLKGYQLWSKEWKPVGMNIDACIFSSSYDIGKTIIDFLQNS